MTRYNECDFAISPNSLDSCDIVDKWIIDGNSIDGPFTYNERVEFTLNETSEIEICMAVTRLAINGSKNVKDSFVEPFHLHVRLGKHYSCVNDNIENGDFSIGEVGQYDIQIPSTIPGWMNISGGFNTYQDHTLQPQSLSGFFLLNTKPIVETSEIARLK
ncbi:MAG: hypothetical protein R2766_01040 [Saprospiraceae bacterium]